MQNNQTKPNTLKAFFMCALACLAGALLFGIIYYIGYYIYYITALEIVFGVLAFLKYKQSNSKGNIAISMILSTLLVVLFNFGAVVLCEAIFLANEYALPFNEALNVLIEVWQTEPEVITYFNQRLGQIAGMAIIGCVIAIFMIISRIKKQKTQAVPQQQPFEQTVQPQPINDIDNFQPTNVNNQTNNNDDQTAQKVYFEYYSQCKVIVQDYISNKDLVVFKQKINSVKQHSNELSDAIKNGVKDIINKEALNLTLSSVDKKTLEILARIF